MTIQTFPKDPLAILDFPFDWTDWLADGESISSYTITPDTGITVDNKTESGGVITVWLSGGTDGEIYLISCLVDTDRGRTDNRSIKIAVADR